jgi:hypothetical protein
MRTTSRRFFFELDALREIYFLIRGPETSELDNAFLCPSSAGRRRDTHLSLLGLLTVRCMLVVRRCNRNGNRTFFLKASMTRPLTWPELQQKSN